jgi:hypothetical protein
MFSRLCFATLLLLSLEARAQFALSLPKVHAVNGYYEPALVWLPGGAPPARGAGYGLGFELIFRSPSKTPEVPSLSPEECRGVKDGLLVPITEGERRVTGVTSDGKACTVCYAGQDAFGKSCTSEKTPAGEEVQLEVGEEVQLEVGVGYAQRGSYGGSPLFLLNHGQTQVPMHAVLRATPRIGFYFNRKTGDKQSRFYWGPVFSLVTLNGQGSLPGAEGATPTPIKLEATTVSASLVGGFAFNKSEHLPQVFLEASYEFNHFPYVAIDQRPWEAKGALTLHSAQVRLAFQFDIQD